MKKIEDLKGYKINTRYRGSKTKVLPLIFKAVKDLKYFTILDCFGGTGAVSYLFKKLNKSVVYNDHLKFNQIIGRALIENSSEFLQKKDIDFILRKKDYHSFPHIIEKNFKGIYYTNDENIWLDRIISNIREMTLSYKQDMAYWCLFQSCIIKRPFSLFHRKNLNIRMRDVERSFGNKTTWDRSFDEHFMKFVKELNSYIFNSTVPCLAVQYDIKDIPNHLKEIIPNNNHSHFKSQIKDRSLSDRFDLVYIDPPYIPQEGENIIYRDLYHFLEGITQYDTWENNIDLNSKHRRLVPEYNIWNDKKNVYEAFESIIKKFQDSILLISHRSEGLPSTERIISILKNYKEDVKIVDKLDHKYALSLKNSKEVLILAK